MARINLTALDMDDLSAGCTINAGAEDGSEHALRGADLTVDELSSLAHGGVVETTSDDGVDLTLTYGETDPVSHLDDLIAAEEACRQAVSAARARLEEAEQAVLAERFKDDEHFNEGDVVLVPRKLFGQRKMWPARVAQVHLNYNTGTYGHGANAGQPWETKSISYTVFHANAGGDGYATTSEGYHHRDVEAMKATA